MNKIFWNNNEDQLLIENVGKLPLKKVWALHFPYRTFDSVRYRKSELKLYRDLPTMNENFFEALTPITCAIAGYISADGCIQTNNVLKFCCHLEDEIYIKKILDLLQSDGKLRYITGQRNIEIDGEQRTFYGEYVQWHSPSSKKLCSDLYNNFNLTPAKSLTYTFPNIDRFELILPFLSGSIDGDGTIHRQFNKTYTTSFSLIISFLGTETYLNWVKSWCDKITPLDTKSCVHRKSRKSKIFKYSINGIRAYIFAKMVLAFNIPRLNRKWDIAKEYINEVESIKISNKMRTKLNRMFTPEIQQFIDANSPKTPVLV